MNPLCRTLMVLSVAAVFGGWIGLAGVLDYGWPSIWAYLSGMGLMFGGLALGFGLDAWANAPEDEVPDEPWPHPVASMPEMTPEEQADVQAYMNERLRRPHESEETQ